MFDFIFFLRRNTSKKKKTFLLSTTPLLQRQLSRMPRNNLKKVFAVSPEQGPFRRQVNNSSSWAQPVDFPRRPFSLSPPPPPRIAFSPPTARSFIPLSTKIGSPFWDPIALTIVHRLSPLICG